MPPCTCKGKARGKLLPTPATEAHGKHKGPLREQPVVQVAQSTNHLVDKAGHVVWIHQVGNASWGKESAVLLVGSRLPLRVFVW